MLNRNKMEQLKLKIKDFFIYIVPITILLNIITIGHWEVEYYSEKTRYVSSYVYGFPFPSHGAFSPVQTYNSGDESVNCYMASLNTVILLTASLLLYKFLLKGHLNGKYFWRILTPFIYLLGLFSLVFYIDFFGSDWEWFSDFRILNYQLWRL